MKNLGKIFVAATLSASPWLSAACGGNSSGGGDGDGDGNAGGRTELCRSICTQLEECGSTNRQECVQTCQGDEVTSNTALQIIDDCYSSAGCGTSATSCLTTGIANIEPGPAVESFCQDLAAFSARCLGEEVSVVECRNLYGFVASGYLADVGECLEESCSVVESCMTSVTSRYEEAGGSIIELATGGGGGGGCCTASDTCDWADDGVCDCGGAYAWDANDCNDSPADCCTSADNCDWANDGVCDCGGAYAWDANDCNDSPADCCTSANNCDWANDGVCDCGGAYAWDANDCSSPGGDSCIWALDGECDEPTFCDYGTDTTDCGAPAACPYTNDGECDEGTFCDFGTDTADCSGSCCSAGDPCDWASDGYCDCDGYYSWDAGDCF